MWHRLPLAQKRPPSGYVPSVGNEVPANELIQIEAGPATLGVEETALPFAWDNERPRHRVHVERFAIDRHNVTNGRYLEFVEAGGYDDARWWTGEEWQWINEEKIRHPLFWERQEGEWFWRGMFDLVPLPLAWPVYVSQTEACAFARWQGRRLPTEAEFQRAAFGTPEGAERRYPW
ncbi:MAG: ergothioneine biosynthesis protein EgtB, partial [Acidobacteria bacterium]